MTKPTFRQQMGVALRNARKSKNLTLKQVAQLVNKHYGSNWGKQNVSDIELGKSFSFETYADVLTVLGFEVVDEPLKPIEIVVSI